MPAVLQNSLRMPSRPHASNGARLASRTGEALSLRGITLTCEAMGGIARTRLRQSFTNAYPNPLELVYSLPLPVDGTVAGYEIRAGDRVIRGRVERRDEARAQYDAARLVGRTAALVEQDRPNLFTQYVGNIPASTDVIVELTIDHRLTWIPAGAWEWRFPTVVAPRYLAAEGVVRDADRVTVDVMNGASTPTVSVALTIADDLPAAPTSSTHAIEVADHTVTLAGETGLDRDIVIRWAAARQAPGCTLRTVRPAESDATAVDSAYGLLTIVPPVATGENLDRDLVLLLDISGSMAGKPLEHLKAVVSSLVDSLDDNDRLDMVAFSSNQVRFRAEPVRAIAAERGNARTWIEGLTASGGTELISAIGAALRPLRADVPRQVVVVTDGLIGFEAAAVRAIREGLPQGSRLHAVGVGSASNRAFLRPAARAGRGVEVLIDLDEPANQGAERIVAATRAPVAIDVTVQGTALQDAAPRLPDLLTGSPVLAALRLRPEGGTLVVRAKTTHGVWEERLDVQGTLPGEGSEAVQALWARETIEDLELDVACGGEREEIDPRIEQIALQYSVSSRLSSWVAIAEEPSVDPRDPVRIERIPQALPYGMSAEGLGLSALPAMLATSQRGPSALNFRVATPAAEGRLDFKWERMAKELEARLGEIREIAVEEIARLRHFVTEIEESTLWQREFVRSDPPIQETEVRRRALLERLERLGYEAHNMGRKFEPLVAHIERVKEMIVVCGWPPPVPLRGRVFPTPGKPTVTVEILVTSGLHWRPAPTATVGRRTVSLVKHGTTQPGPIVAGSLVRVELTAVLDDIARAGKVEIGCGDSVLVVALDVEE